MQEAYQKDVERAFGVLQARYAIIRLPGRLSKHPDLCIILHNMTVEDEDGSNFEEDFEYDQNACTR
jgi:hypothetical protein